jgi:hypothetical protein
MLAVVAFDAVVLAVVILLASPPTVVGVALGAVIVAAGKELGTLTVSSWDSGNRRSQDGNGGEDSGELHGEGSED